MFERNIISMENDVTDKNDGNPKHISGIYNYCDRWCGRCPFTSRCLNFEMSEEKFDDPQSRDINNEAFWQKLGETLHETLTMLKEMAAEKGIDLDTIDTEEEQAESSFEEKSVVHMTTHLAKSYISMTNDWFDANVYIDEDEEGAFEAISAPDLTGSTPREDARPLIDAVDVIRWYQHQIYVKLHRAFHSSRDEEFEILNDFPKDSDGSTKVALIGMDRSISAWGEILKFFPYQEEKILGIIAHLDRLRNLTETEFPDARAFVRPGFDETVPDK
jgi:hypothetical protein